MKQKLTAGTELDLLTQSELQTALKEHARDVAEIGPTTIRATETLATDGSGNLHLDVYQVPAGRRFKLTRVIILADGFTPESPYQGTGHIYIRRNRDGQIVDFLSLTAASGGGIPAKGTDSDSQAAEFVNGENVHIEISGGPTSTNVEVFIQGPLMQRVPKVVTEA